jgi:capsular exopolysaccharide synthesis family protein
VCQRALNFKPKHDKHISRQPFVLERPNSPEGEALRGLVTSVAPWHQGSAPRVLLVASSHAGEGKSTIAANLAIALARTGKTCLVDADLRNPVLASIFRVRHERGLAALLSGDCDLEHALVALDEVPNLTLLPGGSTDARSIEFLTSQKFRSLLETLRDRFQYVIVDSSPLLPYADARVIAPLGEGIVLVARAGATTGEALQRSLEILHSVHAAPVLDVVLNAVPHRSLGYGYNYRYAS